VGLWYENDYFIGTAQTLKWFTPWTLLIFRISCNRVYSKGSFFMHFYIPQLFKQASRWTHHALSTSITSSNLPFVIVLFLISNQFFKTFAVFSDSTWIWRKDVNFFNGERVINKIKRSNAHVRNFRGTATAPETPSNSLLNSSHVSLWSDKIPKLWSALHCLGKNYPAGVIFFSQSAKTRPSLQEIYAKRGITSNQL
jgi:hypothetical protein